MFHTVTALCGYLRRINSTKFKLRTLSRNLDFNLPVSTRSVRNMPYRALRNVSYRALLDTHKVFWFQFWGSRRILFSPFSFFWVFSLNFFRWQNLCLCVWVFFSSWVPAVCLFHFISISYFLSLLSIQRDWYVSFYDKFILSSRLPYSEVQVCCYWSNHTFSHSTHTHSALLFCLNLGRARARESERGWGHRYLFKAGVVVEHGVWERW